MIDTIPQRWSHVSKANPKGTRGGYDIAASIDFPAMLGLGPYGGRIGCPTCQRHNSLAIYWDHPTETWKYRCVDFNCDTSGDAVEWISRTNPGISYGEAAHIAGHSLDIPRLGINNRVPPAYELPHWQACVAAIVEDCAVELAKSKDVTKYLGELGIGYDTAKRYRLGYNCNGFHTDENLGVIDDYPLGLYIPRGIMIPWILPGHDYMEDYDETPLYSGLNIYKLGAYRLSDLPRRPDGSVCTRFSIVSGSTPTPYPTSMIRESTPAIYVAGHELDTLAVVQLIGGRFNVLRYEQPRSKAASYGLQSLLDDPVHTATRLPDQCNGVLCS